MQKINYKNPEGHPIEKYGKVIFRSPKGIIIFQDNDNRELIIKPDKLINIEKIPKMKILKKE